MERSSKKKVKSFAHRARTAPARAQKMSNKQKRSVRVLVDRMLKQNFEF